VIKLQRTGLARQLFTFGEMSTGRIEAFSDGVFAIVITLLVLEIHVPLISGPDIESALRKSLAAMAPKFFAYALSFMIVCIWWVAHHHLFNLLRKSDRGLLWFNSLFLLWLAFIPFPTALLGDYPRQRIAVICYGAVMTLAGLSFCWMRYYAFFVASLTRTGLPRNLMKRAMAKSLLNPALHLLAILTAYLNTRFALALYFTIPLLYLVPSQLEKYKFPQSDNQVA
jgi:uncharacterized membrane protein